MDLECQLNELLVVQFFKGSGDIRDCNCCKAVKFHECGVKMVRRVLEQGFVE